MANVFFFVGSAVEPTLDFEEVAAEEAAAVANPAAAEQAEIVGYAGDWHDGHKISSQRATTPAETVLAEAQRRAARAGKKPRAMDEGEQEDDERLSGCGQQRALTGGGGGGGPGRHSDGLCHFKF